MKRLLLLLLVCCGPAFANDVYIAQSSAGGNNGADCADAVAVGYFNSSGNWTAGTPTGIQIGPGTTVHLCGTFTGTVGSNMLTIQGSGSSGHPVTVLFEIGAVLQAPYWGFNPYGGSSGAIVCNGYSYITVNGNNTGIVKNTANGTSRTYHKDSTGISFISCPHGTVENLTVADIYVQTSTSDSAGIGVTGGIFFDQSDAATITGNTVTQVSAPINLGFENGSPITTATISGNTLADFCHGISIGDGGSNSSASGINAFGNDLEMDDVWADVGSSCHGDGFIVESVNSGSTLSNSSFYNNKVHGSMCSSAPTMQTCTAWMFFTGDMSNVNIFNNLTVTTAGTYESLIRLAPNSYGGANMSNFKVLNNTADCGPSGPIGIKVDGTYSGFTWKNNIIENCVTVDGWAYNDAGSENFAPLTSNNNVFYANSYVAQSAFTATQYSLTTWRSTYSQDAGSTTSDPMLDGSYVPQAGSSAIGLGANLCSLGITALDSDAANSPRPCPSGAWDAGAYNSGTPAVATPVISPGTGTLSSPQTVTITDATPGASIFYSTSGTATCSSTAYSGPFSQGWSGTITISAIGCLGGYSDSATASVTYTQSSGTNGTPAACPMCGVFARKE